MSNRDCPEDNGLEDIFPFVFNGKSGVVMVLAGYFDESERSSGAVPICLAGYVFRPTAYKQFRRTWKRSVLKLNGRQFSHFHMTDLYAGRGEYAGIGIQERAEVLDAAVTAILRHMLIGIAIHFDQNEFQARAPAWWPQRYGSIYTAACQMALQATGFWLKGRRCYDQVFYVFEAGHKWRSEADDLLYSISQHENSRRRFSYHKHMFDDKKREHGLQGADLLAWFISRAAVGGYERPIRRAFHGPLMRLTDEDKGRCCVSSITGDKLIEFFLRP